MFADLLAKSWHALRAEPTQIIWQRLRDEFVASLPAELAARVTVETLRAKLQNERRAIRDER